MSSITLTPSEIIDARQQCTTFLLVKMGINPASESENNDLLNKSFHDIPHSKFIEQCQYLKEYMLPKIAANRGENSADYKFYFGVFQSLMYSMKLLDRDFNLRMRLSNEKSLREFYQGKMQTYEAELMKHTTIQDLLATETANDLLFKKTTL